MNIGLVEIMRLRLGKDDCRSQASVSELTCMPSLYLQHWLFQTTLGYNIDGKIIAELSKPQANGKPLRVADIACGNA